MESARAAVAADLPELVRLGTQAIEQVRAQRGGPMWLAHLERDDITEAGLAALVEDPEVEVVVGAVDEVPVGYIVAQLEAVRSPATGGPATVARIDHLFVEAGARSVGVGEALLDHVLDWARTRGCVGIEGFALPGDRDTKNLFERFGLVARAILVFKALDEDSP